MKKGARIKELLTLNDEQEVVLDLDSELIVEAGAGSGKTRGLVARYLHILEQGRADVDGIVAITFTENAAAEMRERIRKEVNAYISKYGETNFLNRETIRKLPNAPISTIHGFAARLIQENPLESMLSPGFSVLEGVEKGLFTQELMDEFISKLWESEDRAERELLFEVLSEEGFDRNELKETISTIISKAQTLHLEPPWSIFSNAESPKGEEEGLLEVLLRKIHSDFINPSRYVQARVEKIRDIAPKLPLIKKNSIRAALLSEIKESLEGIPGLKSAKEEEKSTAAQLTSVVDSILNLYDTMLTRMYLTLSERAWKFLQEKKSESGFLDYEDLLITARKLLMNSTHLVNHYRKKFRFIMVDEFQDTDSLQFEIINHLRENNGANLFFVGDPKQSIFRFRGADHRVFLTFNKQAKNPKTFAKNYRSKKPLIHFFNGFFKELLDPQYKDMIPNDDSNPEKPCIEFILTPANTAPGWRKEEAKKIAVRILKFLELGYAFKDIAILLRSKNYIYIYENALQEMGIPFHSISGGGFFGKQEILDLWSFLRYLIHPKDKIAEACVLRSPFLGASDDELLAFYSGKEEVPRFKHFLSFVSNLRREVLLLPPLSMLERILEETGYGASLLALPDGKAKYTNLNKLINIVATLSTLGMGIAEIVDHIESSFVEDAESVPQAELEQENAVKILTIHKAKGLEFPVVVLADLNHGRGGEKGERIIARREEGFLVSYKDSESSLWESIHSAEREDDIDEEKRILYVAKTRAKDRLIISIGGKKNKDGRMSLSKGTFAKFLDSVIGFLPDCEEGEKITTLGLEIPIWKETAGERIEIQIDDTKGLKKFNIADIEGRFLSILGQEEHETERNLFPICGKPSPMEIGTLMHRFLETWDFKEDSISSNTSFVLNEGFVSDGSLEEELTKLAKNFLNSELMQKIKRANTIYREVPFYIEIDGKSDRGQIDLVLEKGGKPSLFDYKYINNLEELMGYKQQMERYGRMLERRFGVTPNEKFFVVLPEVRLIGI